MGELKRQVQVELMDQTVSLPVNMGLIETIERVYDININFAVVALQNPAKIKVTQLAEVYLSWLTGGHLEQLSCKRHEVREYIYRADIDTIDRLAGAIMGAALHFRNDISGEDMDTLAQGKSLEEELDFETKKPQSGPEQASNYTSSSSEG